jgi:hypothetical protein
MKKVNQDIFSAQRYIEAVDGHTLHKMVTVSAGKRQGLYILMIG